MIGTKVKGFIFESGQSGIRYLESMNVHIGQKGEIVEISNTFPKRVRIKFDTCSWWYPLEGVKKQFIKTSKLD